MSEPTTSRRPALALAIVGVALTLALGGWIGVVVLFPNLGTEFDEQLPGSRSQHLAVRRLRGLTGTRHELQLLPDYYDGEPVWRVPLPGGARDVVLTPALSVLRTPRELTAQGARLEAYDHDSGELVWSLEDDDAARSRRPTLVPALGLLLEVRDEPLRLRAIELESGHVRWELEDPAITPDLWLERVHGPELLLGVGPNILAVSASEGTLRSLGPPGAVSVDVCGDGVASLDSEGVLRVASIGGGVRTAIGRAPMGTVSCVTDGERMLVGWAGPTLGPDRFDRARHGELDLITEGVVPADAPGAVLGVEGVRTSSPRRLWAATTRWGGAHGLRLQEPCSLGLGGPRVPLWELDDEEPQGPLPRVWFDCATGTARPPPSRAD